MSPQHEKGSKPRATRGAAPPSWMLTDRQRYELFTRTRLGDRERTSLAETRACAGAAARPSPWRQLVGHRLQGTHPGPFRSPGAQPSPLPSGSAQPAAPRSGFQTPPPARPCCSRRRKKQTELARPPSLSLRNAAPLESDARRRKWSPRAG